MKPENPDSGPSLEERGESVFSGGKIDWRKMGITTLPYSIDYCDKLMKYFDTSLGELIKGRFQANPMPHFSKFARSIGTTEEILNHWATIFPEWKFAMQLARDMRDEVLKDNALLGRYDSGVAKLFLSHFAGIKEKAEPPALTGLSLAFAQGINHYLKQRGEEPIVLPGVEEADYTEVVEEKPVSDAGASFKEFRAKRQKS